ncbi:MAG: hypothetical protein RJA99_3225 [Pseudomonadota bacterium]|jgi:hypothetical protein
MKDQDILGRLVRIETRLSKLMTFFGLNPHTGEPLPNDKQRTNDGPRTQKIERQQRPDRR